MLLYAMTVVLTNIPTAVTAVWVYAFFAFGTYLETLGLHFISSTVAFLLFFYMLLRGFSTRSPRVFAISGILAGLCYLSYTSSYIALPILCVAFLLWSIRKWDRSYLGLFPWAIMGFLLCIAPFATYAATTRNYFLERITQVSLINGDWSPHKNVSFLGSLPILWENLILSLRSLVS